MLITAEGLFALRVCGSAVVSAYIIIIYGRKQRKV